MTTGLVEIYIDALTEVESLAMTFEKEMKQIDSEFTAVKFTSVFELLLQHSLLEVAFYDVNIQKEELTLIKTITKYADIVKFSQKTKYRTTWGDLLCFNPIKTGKWLSDIRRVLSDFVDGFAIQFAAFETLAESGSLETVKKGVHAMTALLSGIDKKPDHQEAKTIVQSIIFEAFAKIRYLLDRKGVQ